VAVAVWQCGSVDDDDLHVVRGVWRESDVRWGCVLERRRTLLLHERKTVDGKQSSVIFSIPCTEVYVAAIGGSELSDRSCVVLTR
jgi:hypothetical protein